MELLPQELYQVFAQPPNMITCTRDVYNFDLCLLSNIYEAYQVRKHGLEEYSIQ